MENKKKSEEEISAELKETIDLYVRQELNEEQIHELWSDLVQDPAALEYLKTAANLHRIARLDQQNRDGEITGKRRPWIWMVASAALLLIAAIGLFQPIGQDGSVSPVDQIELDYYRSSDDQPRMSEEERAIREAIMLANRGESYQAIQLIDSTLNRVDHPLDRARLELNAGSILYNMAQYEEAAQRFVNITVMELGEELGEELLKERAFWYLGNAYFQMNRLEEAKQAFRQTYELNGAYSRVAERYLESLPT